MSLQTVLTSILLTLLISMVYTQQPAPLPTPGYLACYEMERMPCIDEFYVNNYGCDWDSFDQSCMCIVGDNNINVVYLIDISLTASPSQTEFDSIAALIKDVTDSTLILRDGITEVYHQMILYDEQSNELPAYTDATTINIDQCCGSRTQLNDLPSAINVAIELFDGLDGKTRVLVIFNGQQQSDYSNDTNELCPLKSDLNNEGISITDYVSLFCIFFIFVPKYKKQEILSNITRMNSTLTKTKTQTLKYKI